MHNIEPKYQFVIDKINKLIRGLKKRNVSVKNVSDGYHTFDDLYDQRAKILAVAANCEPLHGTVWKSHKHYTGQMTLWG